MAKKFDNINELAALFKDDGDKILDASSKLSLSTTLLHRINASFTKLFKNQLSKHNSVASFDVVSTVNTNGDIAESILDLQFIYDFLQKTIALKILPSSDIFTNPHVIDINVFHNLKLLEIQRFSTNLIKGIKNLRAQLQYLTCVRSLGTLKEVLEWCGADRCQGFIWSELKEAVFTHNGLNNLDASLEFTPCLQTLDLSHNRIRNAQPLNCLSHLKYLNLSFNQLESIPVFNSSTANRLEVLIVRNNYIENLQELSTLSGLQQLDLSENCLLEHTCLVPLSNLPNLCWLSLQGNPLSFHPQHRTQTARNLHLNAASNHFILEYVALSRTEQRLVGSIHPLLRTPLERSSSFNSTTTASTVVPMTKKDDNVENVNQQRKNGTNEKQTQTNLWLDTAYTNDLVGGMQDSGFVAGPRPASPSECSIGKRIFQHLW